MRRPLIAVAKLAVSAMLIALIIRTFDIRGGAGYLARPDSMDAVIVLALALAVASLPGAGSWLASGEFARSLGEAASLLTGTGRERAAVTGRKRAGRADSGP